MQTLNLAARRWWYIMPIVFITYSLAYLDRANYGFAAASGMAEDLMITPGLSSLLGALFFLGYFFFQIPGAIYAQKHSVKKLIFVSLILWGSLATLTGVVSNAYWLIVIRFMLGVVEAAVMPAMLVTTSPGLLAAATTAPAANSSESPGRNGVTTSPVSQKMIRNRMAYVHPPYCRSRSARCVSMCLK